MYDSEGNEIQPEVNDPWAGISAAAKRLMLKFPDIFTKAPGRKQTPKGQEFQGTATQGEVTDQSES